MTQCPYCQNYIVNSLAPAWETKGFEEIVDIILVPWGHETFNKSSETGQYSYSCQHGPNECIGQRLESCASMLTPQYNTFVTFIIQLETEMYKAKCQNETNCCDPTTMAQNVAQKLNMPWHEIENCVNTPQIADQAEMMSYTNTMSLQPPLASVPWITLQGNHTDAIQNSCETDTLTCVCNVYKGNSPACKKNNNNDINYS